MPLLQPDLQAVTQRKLGKQEAAEMTTIITETPASPSLNTLPLPFSLFPLFPSSHQASLQSSTLPLGKRSTRVYSEESRFMDQPQLAYFIQ
jgi:hypothetical protein